MVERAVRVISVLSSSAQSESSSGRIQRVSGDRPEPGDLVDVPDEEYLVRLVGSHAYEANAPGGRFITAAWIPSSQYKTHPNSYGPSVWVESKLPAGVASLEKLRPDWAKQGLVRVRVADVRACSIQVKYSPQDSCFPEHADAHASFVGVDRVKRDDLVDVCQNLIVRHPIVEDDDTP
jgi:hypothetical protein